MWLILLLLAACGGPPDAAASVTVAAGRAIHAADLEVARAATQASEAAIQRAQRLETPEQRMAYYDEQMTPWGHVVAALAAAGDGWRVLDAAMTAWEAGADGAEQRWGKAAACLFGALMHAVDLFHAVGLDPPRDLLDAAQALAALIDSDSCTPR